MADDGEGGFYGAFASKLGSGAAKAGKKFAQSEAGRSATKAAVKGATDAATKDLTSRYLGGDEEPPKPAPQSKPRNPSVSTSTSNPPLSSPSFTSYDNDDDIQRPRADSYTATRSPQKPSILNRFKPSITLKSGSTNKSPTVRKPTKRKVYKYALSKEANWDQLPQAIALYNFRAEMKCDLEFRKGQVIQVITRMDSQNDWWEGRIDDRVGIFPANYVKLR